MLTLLSGRQSFDREDRLYILRERQESAAISYRTSLAYTMLTGREGYNLQHSTVLIISKEKLCNLQHIQQMVSATVLNKKNV